MKYGIPFPKNGTEEEVDAWLTKLWNEARSREPNLLANVVCVGDPEVLKQAIREMGVTDDQLLQITC
jgi:hypothetical protein